MPGKADEGDDDGKGADERGKKEREFLFLVVFCCLKMIQESLDHPHPHPSQESKKEMHFQIFIQIQHKKSFLNHLRGKKRSNKEKKKSDFVPEKADDDNFG